MNNKPLTPRERVEAALEYPHCSCDVCDGTKYAPADFTFQLAAELEVANKKLQDTIDYGVREWKRAEATERALKLIQQDVYNLTEKVIPNIKETAERQLADEKTIVDRIWDMFGRPSYESLGGKSIYDLIAKVQDDSRRLARYREKYGELE